MKKVLIITLALLLVGCANKGTKERLYPSEVCVWRNGNWTTDWMQKYVEYVRSYDDFYTDERIIDIWHYWGLAYIDNDTIPEMLLLYGCEATGNKVLTIHDGKVTEWNSWRCGVSYIPKSGLINNEDGSMGHYYDRIIKLENGEFDLVYMKNEFESFEYLDSIFVYYDGEKYSYANSPQKYNRYSDDSVKQSLYISIGQSIDFNAIDSLYPTAFFEKDWKPTLPDGVSSNDYKIILTVK